MEKRIILIEMIVNPDCDDEHLMGNLLGRNDPTYDVYERFGESLLDCMFQKTVGWVIRPNFMENGLS